MSVATFNESARERAEYVRKDWTAVPLAPKPRAPKIVAAEPIPAVETVAVEAVSPPVDFHNGGKVGSRLDISAANVNAWLRQATHGISVTVREDGIRLRITT